MRIRTLIPLAILPNLNIYIDILFLFRLNMVAVWNNDGKFEMLREVSDLLANEESDDENEDGGDDSS